MNSHLSAAPESQWKQPPHWPPLSPNVSFGLDQAFCGTMNILVSRCPFSGWLDAEYAFHKPPPGLATAVHPAKLNIQHGRTRRSERVAGPTIIMLLNVIVQNNVLIQPGCCDDSKAIWVPHGEDCHKPKEMKEEREQIVSLIVLSLELEKRENVGNERLSHSVKVNPLNPTD